jgi:MtrB/PioB family decaheme-associated outer membrane protein
MKGMLLAVLILLMPVVAAAQDERVETSGSLTAGVQQVDVDRPSAHFGRFEDIRDGFYLYDLHLEGIDSQSGHFFDFRGRNLIREDQDLRFGLGSYGLWRLDVERNETPNRLSDRAMTPYIYRGNGLFTVPGQVGLIDDGDAATGWPSLVPPLLPVDPTLPRSVTNPAQPFAGTPDQPIGQPMNVNDQLIAAYLERSLRPVEIGTQRKRDSATLTLAPLDFLKFRLTYSDERKDGSKITYGPIGDRPPRTLNVQFTEPIDYHTRELRAEADLLFDAFQGRIAYQLSDFSNNVDTLRWQNFYFTPNVADGNHTLTAVEDSATAPGGIGTTQRLVSAFGQRALEPDNRYHNVSGSFGIDLPMASRLTASAAYGWMKQDKTLLPYSYLNAQQGGVAWNDPARLPRQSADAEINTMLFNLDYSINPLQGLNLRPFFRYYDLDNDTGRDRWLYVSQDTTGSTGGVNYRNHRVNLPYAYDKMNYGLDAGYTLAFWRTTIGLGYEREEIDRDFREADTDEDIFKASLRLRPADLLNARLSVLYGDRKGKNYNFRATDQSYWYTFADAPQDAIDPATGLRTVAADRDNPLFAFANHPDLRKYDVSDRERHQLNAAVTVTPAQGLDLTATFDYREDDFGSGVNPSQPLLNFPEDPDKPEHTITDAARNASTLGIQLGLLEEKRQQYGIDAYYAPVERWNLSAFANREEIDSEIWGMVFNENRRENLNRINPDIINLGRWDDPRYLYNVTMEDRTNTFGVGGGFEIVPGRIKLSTDYTLSRGKVDWDYRGYGTDFSAATTTTDPAVLNWETNQFGFRSPQTVRNNHYTLNASLEYQLVQNLIFGLHYLFDRYGMDDWMEEAIGPWVEQVGSEYYLRDTSLDNRWGNRLVTMATPLAGSYEAHVGYLTMTYRF